jgi:hypothetical protein
MIIVSGVVVSRLLILGRLFYLILVFSILFMFVKEKERARRIEPAKSG